MTPRENQPPTPDSRSKALQIPVGPNCDQIESDAVLLTIVASVSELVGKELSELPPLNDTIDIDALADTFRWDSAESSQIRSGCVTFRYEGCEVTVFADGQVVVSPPER